MKRFIIAALMFVGVVSAGEYYIIRGIVYVERVRTYPFSISDYEEYVKKEAEREAFYARQREYNIKMQNLRNELSPKIKKLEVLIEADRKSYKDTKEALKGVRESIFNAINEDDTDTKVELEKIEQSYIKLRNEIKKNIDNNKALLKNLKSQYDKTFVPY